MSPIWPPEHKARLIALMGERGLSRADIAVAINKEFSTTYTRNSVIGMAHRMGLQSPGKKRAVVPKKRSPRPRVSKKIAQQPVKRLIPYAGAPRSAPPVQTPQHAERLPKREPAEVWADTRFDHYGLLELRTGQCRWPHGDSPFRFCGRPAYEKDCPYCASHLAQARRAA